MCLDQAGDNMKEYKLWMIERRAPNLAEVLEKTAGDISAICSRDMGVKIISEGSQTSRYSIAVDYRTDTEDVLEAFAKLVLGYVSAGLKKMGFHTKHVYEEKPLRLMVSSRNWDDGEWVGLVSWSDKERCFLISKGFYNKDRRTVSVQSTKRCADSASEIAKELSNTMRHLKDQPDRHHEKLKPVSLKRGPK